MQPPVDVWQGCLGYWQATLIRENFLPLGYLAWQGYLTQGRGMVACEMQISDGYDGDWSEELVQHVPSFVPASTMPDYFQCHHLQVPYLDRLMQTVQTYRPQECHRQIRTTKVRPTL
jgi:hypothetical protein